MKSAADARPLAVIRIKFGGRQLMKRSRFTRGSYPPLPSFRRDEGACVTWEFPGLLFGFDRASTREGTRFSRLIFRGVPRRLF